MRSRYDEPTMAVGRRSAFRARALAGTARPRASSAAVVGAYRYRLSFRYERGYSAEKKALLARLRRIEGQIRGLQRMVDEDTYWIDVLTQISAATKALQAVAVRLLEDHLRHCVVQAAIDGDADAKVKEATAAIARLVKS
jgi:CsoR family transcriptional regulator, copper-sensing transcriptional repressor